MAQSRIEGLPITYHFSADAYAAGNQNWAIQQDQKQLLYAANHFGLLVYDGIGWELYQLEASSGLRSIAPGPKGRIYVGGQGKFGYFDPNAAGKLQFHSLVDKIPVGYRNFEEVWHIYPTDQGVYFTTHSYIFKYVEDSLTVISHPKEISYSFFRHKKLYVSGREEGLLMEQEGRLIPVSGGEILAQNNIRAMIELSPTSLLIATHEGKLILKEGDSFRPWNPDMTAVLESALINCAIQLRDGRLVIGTQNDGLYILTQEGQVLFHLDRDRGLISHTVYGLYEGERGTLWAATNHGISQIELGAPFTLLNEQMRLQGAGYAAAKWKDQLILGTSNGAFRAHEDGFQQIPGSAGQVWSLSVQEGSLLMGHHEGAFVYRNNVFSPFSRQKGAWMFLPRKGYPGQYIQGHYKGMRLLTKQQGNWASQGPVKGFEESSRLYFQDEAGDIWMSHGFKGVYRIQLNSAGDSAVSTRYYGEESGFPTHELINIFKIQERLVFGTIAGAYVYDQQADRMVRDTLIGPLIGFDGRLIELEEGGNGRLYYIKDREIGRLDPAGPGSFRKATYPFGMIRSLMGDDLENIVAIDEDMILISGREGFIQYNPLSIMQRPDSLPLLLRSIQNVSNDSMLEGGYGMISEKGSAPFIPLEFNDQAIRLRVASPALDMQDRLRYRFRVSDFDPDWTTWGPRPEREINGMSPGLHEVWVEVKGEGLRKARKVAVLYVAPPWYRSWWAQLIYAILVLGLMMGLAFMQWKRYQRTRRRLILDKDRAIQTKEREIKRINADSEARIARLKEEQLEKELRSKNRELTSSTMHILAKNEFLQHVKEELARIRKLPTTEQSKELNRLIRSINHNLSDEDDWDRFALHFTQVKGDFFTRLKEKAPTLTPQELKLCAYLSMNMSTKEIAQMLNISVRGVETSRYRLRKKLGLDSQVNLVDFMMQV